MAFVSEIRAIAREIAQAKRAAAEAQGQARGYRYGTVQSTGLGEVSVLIDGNDAPTPCSATAVATAAGHRVAVRVDAHGHGEVLRDYSDPAAGSSAVEAAQSAAEEAAQAADATGQHFWDDDAGIHVTQASREDFVEEATGPNLLANSLGFLLRMAANNLASLTASAVAFYDGSGNADANIMAKFTSTLARIGKSDGKHVDLDTNGLKIFNASTLLGNFLATGAQVGPTNGPHLIIRTDATNYNQSLTGYYIFLDFYMGSTKVGVISSTYTTQGIKVLSIKTQTAELYVNNTDAKIFTTNATVGVTPDGVSMGPNVSVGNNIAVGNNITATGNITAKGHTSAIGTVVDSSGNDSDVSVASGSDKNLCSLTVPAGTWAISCGASFANNSTGRRRINLHTTSASSSNLWIRHTGSNCDAVSGAMTFLHGSHVVEVSGNTTFYLVAYQNSGGALTCQGYLRAVRIA